MRSNITRIEQNPRRVKVAEIRVDLETAGATCGDCGSPLAQARTVTDTDEAALVFCVCGAAHEWPLSAVALEVAA